MNEKTKEIVNKLVILISIISIAIFAYSITPKSFQNDTFYTIKIGEHIVKNTDNISDLLPWNKGLDMQDPFSWHKNLPYTYPHWLYDVGTYAIYNYGGLQGIYYATCILSILLGLVIFVINKKVNKSTVLSFAMTIASLYCLKNFIAARAQLVTFILFALTYFSIEQFLKTKKVRYALMLIIIPIIIANVHSAVWPFYFILYLPYIAEQLIYAIITVDYKYLYKRVHLFFRRKKLNQSEIEKEKLDLQEEKKAHKLKIEKNLGNLYKFRINKEKNIKWLILIMVICAFTGLLTPIKDTPYTYLIKTNQGNTTQNISEHLPLTLIKNNNMMVILTIVLGILIFSKTKIKVRDFFMLAGLILLSFMSQRQVSMLVLICNFIVLKLICELIESVRKNDLKTKNSDIQYIVMFAVFCAIVMCNIALSLKECKIEKNGPFISASSYPIEACNFIENDLIPSVGIENIIFYNEYNYGSYLLYRGIPVFIDSRADLYTPEFNGKKGKDGKYVGRDIFTDFLNISSLASSYESEFEKYKITHVITYSNSKLNSIIAKDGNYKELYDDGSFTIYERLSAQSNEEISE